MLIQELLDTTALTEVKMSYSALRSQASRIDGARVGMEFEMYLPNVEDTAQEPELEPDYDLDGYIDTGTWKKFSDDVVNFFTDTEFSNYTRRELERLLDRDVRPEFDEWVESAWREYAEDELLDWYLRENPDEEDLPPRGTRSYERILDEYRDEEFDDWFSDGDKINDWLEAERIDKYRKFADRYNLDWPHMIDVNEGGGDLSLSDIAEDFSDAVDMPADYSSDYHVKTKKLDRYMIEPDGSLDSPEGKGDKGLEFVSPPLSIDEMIVQLDKVKRWAGRMGAYANASTGLHINVSLPNYSRENLDYVKLALFLGDDWVSEQFGRLLNSYTKSSIQEIKRRIRGSNLNMRSAFNLMKSGMNEIVSSIIHSGQTDKYVSINTKDNRVEFRSPGGDWLDANYDKIVSTMLRFVVALDIAIDPQKEQREYAKKLYKLISTNIPEEDLDTMRYFAQYSAGSLPAGVLKTFVRNIQQKRIEKKLPPEATARPVAPNDKLSSNETEYVIRGARDSSDIRHRFAAISPRAAERYAADWANRYGVPMSSVRVQLAQPERPGQEVGTYRITYRQTSTGQIGTMDIDANSRREATEEFTSGMPGYEIVSFTQI
jgi:hypothetical protein